MKKASLAAVFLTAGAVIWFTLLGGAVIGPITISDVNGRPHSTVRDQGPTLVSFWATSCPECIAEMPHLKELHRLWNDLGFKLLAVAMEYDSTAAIRVFNEREHLPFVVAHDADGMVAKHFGGVRLTPTHFLLNNNGKILYQTIGAPDFQRLHRLIKKHLVPET